MKLPPFAAIRAFESAARHGSMQSASEELFLTPSAISHQVKALEVFIGAALFERKPGGLTLTEVGTTYQKDLRGALNLIEAATSRASKSGDANHITVSMCNSIAELWFVLLLKKFHCEFPDTQISIKCDPIATDFANGIADVSIVYDRIREDREKYLLFEDEIAPCCSEQFLQDNGCIQNPDDILKYPLIWCESDPYEWATWFEYAGLGNAEPHHWVSFDQRPSALQAAREGLGIAMWRRPYSFVDLGGPKLSQPIDVIAPTNCGYYIEAPKRAEYLTKTKLFIHWLIEQCRSFDNLTVVESVE